jgi:hypothetical protein
VNQAQRLAALDFGLSLSGRRQHGIAVNGDPGLQVAVQRVNLRQQRLGQRDRRNGSRANLCGGFHHG